jgi:hypothetical protein
MAIKVNMERGRIYLLDEVTSGVEDDVTEGPDGVVIDDGVETETKI